MKIMLSDFHLILIRTLWILSLSQLKMKHTQRGYGGVQNYPNNWVKKMKGLRSENW